MMVQRDFDFPLTANHPIDGISVDKEESLMCLCSEMSSILAIAKRVQIRSTDSVLLPLPSIFVLNSHCPLLLRKNLIDTMGKSFSSGLLTKKGALGSGRRRELIGIH